MQQQTTLAPHEILELHEILGSEMVCAKKMESGLSAIQDQELSAFVQDTVNAKKQQIRDIQQFVNSNQIIQ
ncbi:hypothetical protein CEB3_c06370 [Peptococcaceae bacterium CEB3]|nr:hypothetical protein CEB3_c06370 [Peptococcaceae bacterium CEB3]